MFELYFGAFDIVLYASAFILALCVESALHRRSAQAQRIPVSAAATSCPMTTMAEGEHSAALVDAPSQEAERIETSSPVATIEKRPDLVAEPQALANPAAATASADKPRLQLDDVRLYKLHKKSVVKVSGLPFAIPETIKRYLLHGEPVVRLEALEKLAIIG